MIKSGVYIIVFMIGVLSGIYVMDYRWQSKWNKAEKQAVENQVNAVKRTVDLYNARIKELENANTETEKKLVKAVVNNNDLDDANNRLQKQFIDSMRERITCDKTVEPVGPVETATSVTDVQSNVFRIISERAVEYAKIADDNRIRGLSCESKYNTLVRSINGSL